MADNTIKKVLFDYLRLDSGVSAQVAERIFPQIAPTSTNFPYITIQRISDPGINHMLAASALANPTFQFDVWGETSLQTEDASEALREALDGLQRTQLQDVYISGVRVENQSDSTERPTDGRQTTIYRTRMDVIIWHDKTVPTFP